MEYDRKPGSLQSFMEYFPKAMKFYSLKNENIARVVFILVLAANFFSQLYVLRTADTDLLITYPENQSQMQEMVKNFGLLLVFSFIRDIAIYIISAFYLLAFIMELRGEPVNSVELCTQVLKRMLPYIAAYIAVSVIKNTGLVFFVIPGILIHILFLFNTSLIIDGKCGFFQSFGLSISLSEGYRRQIFSIVAFVFIFFTTINMIFSSMGNLMSGVAISSFIATVGHLVTLRLTALLYVDLYNRKPREKDEEQG